MKDHSSVKINKENNVKSNHDLANIYISKQRALGLLEGIEIKCLDNDRIALVNVNSTQTTFTIPKFIIK